MNTCLGGFPPIPCPEDDRAKARQTNEDTIYHELADQTWCRGWHSTALELKQYLNDIGGTSCLVAVLLEKYLIAQHQRQQQERYWHGHGHLLQRR